MLLADHQILKQQPDRGHERQSQRDLLEQLLVDVAQQGFPSQRASHGKGDQPKATAQESALISPRPALKGSLKRFRKRKNQAAVPMKATLGSRSANR